MGEDGGLDSVVRPHFGEDRTDVALDGAFDEMEPPADLAVGQAGTDQGKDLPLPLGEALQLAARLGAAAQGATAQVCQHALGDTR